MNVDGEMMMNRSQSQITTGNYGKNAECLLFSLLLTLWRLPKIIEGKFVWKSWLERHFISILFRNRCNLQICSCCRVLSETDAKSHSKISLPMICELESCNCCDISHLQSSCFFVRLRLSLPVLHGRTFAHVSMVLSYLVYSVIV